ncbi:MAG: hypothetical protein JWO60_1836 [Frankiales bacterium]|nr:hypothetical protein [Frankiales bacterium]
MTGPSPAPSPALAPADVVLAQLAALQREPFEGDPAPGEGLAAAFAFASPGNREATGPLPRFAQLLRSEAYRGLLGHRLVQLGPVLQDGDQARVEVLVVAADDSTQGYTWVLGCQSDPPYRDCWMTDGVVRHAERS